MAPSATAAGNIRGVGLFVDGSESRVERETEAGESPASPALEMKRSD